MTNPHLITSPPELVQQWSTKFIESLTFEELINEVARWGADQELEACCEEFSARGNTGIGRRLRAARRPKPSSLKEQALGLLNEGPVSDLLDHEVDTIRRALEALPND